MPDDAWRSRHRALTALLVVHVALLPLYAVYRGYGLVHALEEAVPIFTAALLASCPSLSRTVRAIAAAGGLMLCSGMVVHLSGGIIEAHFHFFVMIPLVAMYEAWPPFALGVAYVLVHHGVMGTMNPRSVYNSPSAWERPWLFAAIHASFFAAASLACIVNWWLHERARGHTKKQAQLLATIVNSLRDGLAVIDDRGRIKIRNPASVDLVGGVELDIGQVGHVGQYGLHHPDGRPIDERDLPFVRALAGERVHDLDLVVRNDGVPEGRVLSFSATALSSNVGSPTGEVVVVFRDVTERHRTQQALSDALATEQAANEQLRRLERAKSDFVATVSHELRTPLTNMVGYLELLTDDENTELASQHRPTLDRVSRNSQRLLVLVEDLLTLSQVESATLMSSVKPADLREVIDEALDTIALQADARSLEVAVELPHEPATCEVDPAQIERMVVNLLTNAVKFSPDGGRIGVKLMLESSDVVVVVSDTGLGIPEAEQGQLFTPFFRSSVATHHAVQGAGLGLSIVKAIVAPHDGTISLTSSPGRGTTFTVRLPRRAPQSTRLPLNHPAQHHTPTAIPA